MANSSFQVDLVTWEVVRIAKEADQVALEVNRSLTFEVVAYQVIRIRVDRNLAAEEASLDFKLDIQAIVEAS